MTGRRGRAVWLGVVALMALGCSTDPDVPAADPTRLPWGLISAPGTELVGRPYLDDDLGDPYQPTGVELRAVFLVTTGDPVEAFGHWVAQFDRFDLGQVVRGGACIGEPDTQGFGISSPTPGMWCRGGGGGFFDLQRERQFGDWASLLLFRTTTGAVLEVRVVRSGRVGPDTIRDFPLLPSVAIPEPIPDRDVTHRAPLTDVPWILSMPVGGRLLVPRVTSDCANDGGSFVLAVEDPGAAIVQWTAEVRGDERTEDAEVERREHDRDGVRIVRASLVVGADVGSIQIRSVRGPGDDFATVYVDACGG